MNVQFMLIYKKYGYGINTLVVCEGEGRGGRIFVIAIDIKSQKFEILSLNLATKDILIQNFLSHLILFLLKLQKYTSLLI